MSRYGKKSDNRKILFFPLSIVFPFCDCVDKPQFCLVYFASDCIIKAARSSWSFVIPVSISSISRGFLPASSMKVRLSVFSSLSKSYFQESRSAFISWIRSADGFQSKTSDTSRIRVHLLRSNADYVNVQSNVYFFIWWWSHDWNLCRDGLINQTLANNQSANISNLKSIRDWPKIHCECR